MSRRSTPSRLGRTVSSARSRIGGHVAADRAGEPCTPAGDAGAGRFPSTPAASVAGSARPAPARRRHRPGTASPRCRTRQREAASHVHPFHRDPRPPAAASSRSRDRCRAPDQARRSYVSGERQHRPQGDCLGLPLPEVRRDAARPAVRGGRSDRRARPAGGGLPLGDGRLHPGRDFRCSVASGARARARAPSWKRAEIEPLAHAPWLTPRPVRGGPIPRAVLL